ncbi:Uncharacterized protein AArcCO_1604 [Halalkaliarchaeum sp. AArc-CO]|uniref:hypothetical protein n=1 Tax=unclassified Halalkaliarchaeum TaxID=2678344 RepID=UPI00217E7CD5|nr:MULTISPECIES: hypothetical protein [unclassified Halalkaliarchaeum]MDR5674188.1 hypothetical protein [Halalkaliarchaeum sp. AArc-GB]UWG50906.1 Uncharacterized protein AArcCO_1604 [Halalkaliarchaeum sp. AArc-CO]
MRTRDVPDENATDASPRREPRDLTPEICTVRTSPGRLLFSETDNPDGWIATDSAVDLER